MPYEIKREEISLQCSKDKVHIIKAELFGNYKNFDESLEYDNSHSLFYDDSEYNFNNNNVSLLF